MLFPNKIDETVRERERERERDQDPSADIG
jgi:hypothetical protein